jgi:Derlin-2/3
LNIFITGGMVFTSCLVLAFAYTSTQDDRGMKANFFIVTIPAQWIPSAMLLMTLVTNGPSAAKVQATGLIAAHLHDFLTRLWPEFGGGFNLVPTPTFIRNVFAKPHATVERKPYGTAFAQPQRAGSGSDNVLPESWKSRGSGHRLGGN